MAKVDLGQVVEEPYLNPTNDFLNSALVSLGSNSYRWMRGSGSAYTGSVPNEFFKYGVGLALDRGGNKTVIIFAETNIKPAFNTYSSGKWSGWTDFNGDAWA